MRHQFCHDNFPNASFHTMQHISLHNDYMKDKILFYIIEFCMHFSFFKIISTDFAHFSYRSLVCLRFNKILTAHKIHIKLWLHKIVFRSGIRFKPSTTSERVLFQPNLNKIRETREKCSKNLNSRIFVKRAENSTEHPTN